ncbi:trichohyalin-like [Procambarus clarkii]|uniref:trichohyalin-like n=1 Tax=Procambarus clarkii TaxID=6728 RepID=UPI0037427397
MEEDRVDRFIATKDERILEECSKAQLHQVAGHLGIRLRTTKVAERRLEIMAQLTAREDTTGEEPSREGPSQGEPSQLEPSQAPTSVGRTHSEHRSNGGSSCSKRSLQLEVMKMQLEAQLRREEREVQLQREEHAAQLQREERAAQLQREERAAQLQREERAAQLQQEEREARLQREERERAAQLQQEERAAQLQREERAAQLQREERAAQLQQEERAARLQREEREARLQREEREARLQREEREAWLLRREEGERQLRLEEIKAKKEVELCRVEHGLPSLPARRDDLKVRELDLPTFESQEAEAFFEHFERIATLREWPEDDWAALVQGRLTGEAREAYNMLDLEECASYDAIKSALLHSFQLTPEMYRKRFSV